MNLYYNELAKISTGSLLFLWNDDAIMISKYWDKIVKTIYENEKNKTVVYQILLDEHTCSTIFPFISRNIYTTLQHLSLNAHVDSWIEDVCRFWRAVPVFVKHLRREENVSPVIYKEADESIELSHKLFYFPESIKLREVDRKKVEQLREQTKG